MNKKDQRQVFLANVLDKGYVLFRPEWIMGSGDLDIVNDARVSYMAESEVLSEKDLRLIKFLGNHGHTSCFRGVAVKIEVYAPLMLARQWWKYVIGSQHEEEMQSDEYAKYQDHFTNWNESSRRYVKEKLEFHVPSNFYMAPENSKQGSGDAFDLRSNIKYQEKLAAFQNFCVKEYLQAIEDGMCVEQARLFLPAYGLYVRWRWTCSLQTLCHFIAQRIDSGSQKGIQMYAKAVYLATRHLFEVSMQELLPEQAKRSLKAQGVEL